MDIKEIFDKTKTKAKIKKLNGMNTEKEDDTLSELSVKIIGEAFESTPDMVLSRNNALKNMEDYTGNLDKKDFKSIIVLHDYILLKYNEICRADRIETVKYLLNDIEVASMRLNTICNNTIPKSLYYEDDLDELMDSLRVNPKSALKDWKKKEKEALFCLRKSYEKKDMKSISKASFMLMTLTLEAIAIKII